MADNSELRRRVPPDCDLSAADGNFQLAPTLSDRGRLSRRPAIDPRPAAGARTASGARGRRHDYGLFGCDAPLNATSVINAKVERRWTDVRYSST
ncbi:hypothetical protein EVAR_36870_1 [Eumeta japonica]|uniref:Uncharacterized protein n=1 Tax=Eumeta variegata TaxID=151549 RepID=A0A4C1WV50_EUMVA|nr:hypothetical protein EVAR_36870_1 [Eumeta japonica]